MAGEYIEFNNNSQPALNDTNINRMQQLIKQDIQGSVSGDTLPVGAIMPFGSDTIPENWLLCNGQAISRTDYQELFNTIGINFGSGDGFTTFNLPDLRNRVPVGKDENDTDFDTLGNTGGEKEHTLTINEMPSHNHQSSNYFEGSGGTSGVWAVRSLADLTGYNDVSSQTGGNQPHNNLQPYIVQNYIIKAKQSAGVVATVVDGLNSTSATNALSANQGRILNEKIQGTILYKNINGEQASSGITLSESVNNYDFIEIYCGKSIAQGLNCAKIDLSIANTVSITNYVKLTSGEAQFITSALSVNGTSLTQISCHYLNISGERVQVGESTEMSVYEVVGYKY